MSADKTKVIRSFSSVVHYFGARYDFEIDISSDRIEWQGVASTQFSDNDKEFRYTQSIDEFRAKGVPEGVRLVIDAEVLEDVRTFVETHSDK